MNILYIHGLGGNKEGASGQYIKAFFEQSGNHQVHLETFDLVAIKITPLVLSYPFTATTN